MIREYPPASVHPDSPMTPEYRATLIRLLADQARAELAASNIYSRWVSRAPGPEERMHLAHIAREETEHWYRTIQILADLGIRPEQARDYQTRSWFYRLFRFLILRTTWQDLLMMAFLIDQGAYFLVEDFAQSSYAPWARLSQDILREEDEHRDFGWQRLRALIDERGSGTVQRALRKWWPISLNMFGRPVTENTDLYIRLGLKFRSNEARRKEFRLACEPQIQALSLKVPRLFRNAYPFF